MIRIKKLVGILAIFPVLLLGLGLIGCASTTAFSISLDSPDDGVTVSEGTITVTGKVAGYPRGGVELGEQTARLVPEVTVNGVSAKVADNGSFSAEVALNEGENVIKAVAYLNNMEDRDSITVTYVPAGPSLISIAVEPASPDALAVDGTQQFTATGTYSDESTADITSEVEWASSDEAVVTIDAAGLATAVGAGTADITASLSDVSSPAVSLTVFVPAPDLTIEITSPEDGEVFVQRTITVTGMVSDPEAILTLNGVVVANDNGSFTAEVVLVEGENVICASALVGETQVEDTVSVVHNPNPSPAPTIEITSPADGAVVTEDTITITGTAGPAGAVVTVNGVLVADHGNGATFTAQVRLVEGENTIVAAAILDNGHLLRAEDSIVVIYTNGVEPSLESIAVEPASAEVAIGDAQQFAAIASYSDGSTADVTSEVAWESSDEAVATIDAAGLATGVAVGSADITASLAEVTSPAASLTVIAAEPTLESIAIEPVSAEVGVGATQQFAAIANYSDGSTADVTSEVTWASSDEAVATIDAAGLATGVDAGSAEITATLGEVTSPAANLVVGSGSATVS